MMGYHSIIEIEVSLDERERLFTLLDDEERFPVDFLIVDSTDNAIFLEVFNGDIEVALESLSCGGFAAKEMPYDEAVDRGWVNDYLF